MKREFFKSDKGDIYTTSLIPLQVHQSAMERMVLLLNTMMINIPFYVEIRIDRKNFTDEELDKMGYGSSIFKEAKSWGK